MRILRRTRLLAAIGALLVAAALVATMVQTRSPSGPVRRTTATSTAATGVSGAGLAADRSGLGALGRAAIPQSATRPAHPAQASLVAWLTFLAVIATLVALATMPLWHGRRRTRWRPGGLSAFPPSFYRCEDWEEEERCRSRTRVG
jgi:hypothetical protein